MTSRFAVLALVSLTACSSAVELPAGAEPVADAGPETMASDTAKDTGSEVVAIDSWSDTRVEVAEVATDSGVKPDTDIDDSGVAVDSAPLDTGSEASAAEVACTAGGPRLTWKGTECFDTLYGASCYQLRASDGVYRCLPGIGTIGGYKASTCTPTDQGFLSATTFTGSPMVSIAMVGVSPPTYVVRYTSSGPRPTMGAWSNWDVGTCKKQLAAYPFANSSGQSLLTGVEDPATDFVTY